MESGVSVVRRLGDILTEREKEFFRLISQGDTDQLIEYLKQMSEELHFHKRNEEGHTPLELAIYSKNDPVISLLLSTGKCLPLDGILRFAIEYGYENGINLIFDHLSRPRLRSFSKTSSQSPVDLNVKEFPPSKVKLPNSDAVVIENLPRSPSVVNLQALEVEFENYDLVQDSFAIANCQGKMCGEVFEEPEFQPAEPLTSNHNNYWKSSLSSDDSTSDPKKVPRRKNSFYFLKKDKNEDHLNKALLCLEDPISLLCSAAISENFAVAQKLINLGISISQPAEIYPRKQMIDSLQDSDERIRDYRALCSATYISLTAEDPIRTSFERSQALKELANKYPENRDSFEELSDYCSEFAVELLSECQSAAEVKRLLCQDVDFIPVFSSVKFGRLHLAVHNRQWKFIAHPSCQHVVSSQWINGLPEWHQWSPLQATMHVILQAFFMIFLFIPYILNPNSKLAAPVRVPLNRFIYAVICYCIFLGCLLTAIILGKNDNEWIIYVVLIWMLTHLIKLIFTDFQGKAYQYLSVWNFYDAVMELLFLTLAVPRICLETSNLTHLLEYEDGLFAIATILAFLRVLQWFHMHRILGPFIVSLHKIVGVLVQLLIVFSILYCAFALGLYCLYSGKNIKDNEGSDFSNILSTVSSLYWTLYGYGDNGIRPVNGTDSQFIDWVGCSLWGLFHVATVTILLNLLIAMMTNAFQKIQDNCDAEWKFARTRLWMSYFEKRNAIPPPFNILIFVKNIFLFINNKGKNRKKKNSMKLVSPDNSRADVKPLKEFWKTAKDMSSEETEDDYSVFINKLVRRYWHTRRMRELNAHK